MPPAPPIWPALSSGRVVALAETGSTNAEAARRAGEGAATGTWVIAERQTAGRGRSGRAWVSAPGNLAASLILRDVVPLAKAYQLALVSGVAVHAALMAALGDVTAAREPPGLELKWPNDILLQRRKLGGILVESSIAGREQGALAIVGIGLNLAHHPQLEGRATTSLLAHGAAIDPLKMLEILDETMQEWLSVWRSGAGFGPVRQAWLERALPQGVGLSVHSGSDLRTGTFAGLDADGALLLQDADGRVRTVAFGDVDLRTT